jgi:hypothetical protein
MLLITAIKINFNHIQMRLLNNLILRKLMEKNINGVVLVMEESVVAVS